jgi:hypothetical protein
MAVLCLDQEQLFAFHMMHLKPIHLGCAIDVVEAHVENPGIETFYFAGEAVAIVHDQYIGFFSCEKWQRYQKYARKNRG